MLERVNETTLTKEQEEYISRAPTFTIYDGMMKAVSVLRIYKNIMVSVSGGSDSDDMIELVEHLRTKDDRHKVTYVFFDTGIELAATKRHLDLLEKKYGIEIVRRRAKVPVPVAVKEHGYPFMSKECSNRIHRLQLHDFDFTSEPSSELYNKYEGCRAAISWYLRENKTVHKNITYVLRNFLRDTPPPAYKYLTNVVGMPRNKLRT